MRVHMDARRICLVAQVFIIAGMVLSAAVRPASAQNDTASLSGRVTDPTNAVVPDAVVEIKNTETGSTTTVRTNSDGIYAVPSLKPGNYLLNVSHQGFRSVSVTGMTLSVQDSLVRNFVLEVGSSAESVTVSADTTVIQTGDAQLGTVVDQQEVNDLPLNGRNFTSLLLLVPGATPISTSQSFTAGGEVGNIAIPGTSFANPSIHGQWNRAVVYMLDGIINTELRVSTPGVQPIVDTIQEFKVQSHDDSAEFGLVTGGVVNVISKSGTNNYHGSLWEFIRNNDFDARDMAESSLSGAAPFHQNQFGAAVGGPVFIPKLYHGKNRTFFEFGYEGWRYSKPALSRYRVPTAAELSGDFSAASNAPLLEYPIFDPTTTTLDPAGNYVRSKFPNNTIPADRIDQQVVAYFKTYLDAPNMKPDSEGNNDIVLDPTTNNDDNYTVKIDERLRDKDSIWFRYTRMNNVTTSPNTNLVSTNTSMPAYNVGGGWLHVFNSSLLLDVQGGRGARPFTNFSAIKPGLGPMASQGWKSLSTLGPVALNLDGLWGPLGASIGTNTTGISGPAPRSNDNYSVSGNLSWLHGRQSIRSGFIWISQHRYQFGPGQSYNFDTVQTADPNKDPTDPANPDPTDYLLTGGSLASSLLSLPSNASYSFGSPIDFWIPTWAAYFQNSWKLSPKVTVNLGLRYDHINQADVSRGLQTSFDGGPHGSGMYWIGGGKMPPSCDVSKAAPCIPDNVPYSQYISLDPNPTHGPDPVWDNVGPRLGVAWSVTNNTVVRAGYGMVFDSVNGLTQSFQNSMNSWPYSGSTSFNYNLPGAPPITVQNIQATNVSPLPGPSPWGNSGTWYEDEHHKNAYSHQWNLEIERQMTRTLVMSIGYAGSATRRLDLSGLANTAQPSAGTPAQVNAGRPFPYYGSSYFFQSSDGQSQYSGLEFKAQSQQSHGFQYLIAYTWSKSTDNGASGWFDAENQSFSTLQDFYHPNTSKGASSLNVPQVLSISGSWVPPIGKGQQYLNSGLASRLLGNWQLNTITSLRSGQYFDLSVPNDPANIGDSQSWFNYARPNLVGSPHLSNPNRQQWFNTSAVAAPVNTFGNMGRSALTSAPVYNTDFSIFKRFPVTEGSAFEFRAEAFNVFNIQSLGVPDSTLGDASFGQVLTGSQPNPARELQFALKFTY